MVGRTLVQCGNVPQAVTNYEYPQVLWALTNGTVAFIQEWNAAWGQIIDKTQNPWYFDKIQYAPIAGVRQSDGTVKRAYHVHRASSRSMPQASMSTRLSRSSHGCCARMSLSRIRLLAATLHARRSFTRPMWPKCGPPSSPGWRLR